MFHSDADVKQKVLNSEGKILRFFEFGGIVLVMKNKGLVLCVVLLAFIAFTTHFSCQITDLTGREWQTTHRNKKKIICLLFDMAKLQAQGVPVGRSPKKYAGAIDAALAANPELKSEDIKNILAAVLYEMKPQSREAIDAAITHSSLKRLKLRVWPGTNGSSGTETVAHLLSPKLSTKSR